MPVKIFLRSLFSLLSSWRQSIFISTPYQWSLKCASSYSSLSKLGIKSTVFHNHHIMTFLSTFVTPLTIKEMLWPFTFQNRFHMGTLRLTIVSTHLGSIPDHKRLSTSSPFRTLIPTIWWFHRSVFQLGLLSNFHLKHSYFITDFFLFYMSTSQPKFPIYIYIYITRSFYWDHVRWFILHIYKVGHAYYMTLH